MTKKIEQTTSLVKAFQMLWGEIKKALYSIVIVVAVGVYFIKNPDVLMDKVSKTFIHDEVVRETEHSHHASIDSLRLEMDERMRKIQAISMTALKKANDISDLESNIRELHEIDSAHEKHLKYLDGGMSHIVDFAIREADKKRSNECEYSWRETNDGEEFIVVYNDSYDVDMIYQLDKRDNCQGFYKSILTGTNIQVR